jgi:hypothetical protein
MSYIDNIQDALYQIADEAKRVIQFIMESDKGINQKVGFNTLIDSDIYDQIDIEVEDISIINILINNYIDNIESGRKPHAPKVPIQDLIKWCNKKGIQADGGAVYAIQESIFNLGIKPRPIMVFVFEKWDEMWDEWVENIINEIVEPLRDFFNN